MISNDSKEEDEDTANTESEVIDETYQDESTVEDQISLAPKNADIVSLPNSSPLTTNPSTPLSIAPGLNETPTKSQGKQSLPSSPTPSTPESSNPYFVEQIETAIQQQQYITIEYAGKSSASVMNTFVTLPGNKSYHVKPIGWKKQPLIFNACYPNSTKQFCFAVGKVRGILLEACNLDQKKS